MTLPAQAHVSLSHRFNDRFKVNASVEWTDWSQLQSLIIRTTALGTIPQTFDWQDGWFFSLGGEYAVNEALTIRAGGAYEISPVRDAHRGPRVPDNDRIWVSAGASYNWNDWLTLHGAYTHIFVKDGDVNLPENGGYTLVAPGEFRTARRHCIGGVHPSTGKSYKARGSRGLSQGPGSLCRALVICRVRSIA